MMEALGVLQPTVARAALWTMLLLFPVASVVGEEPAKPDKPAKELRDPREVHLADLRQLTFAGENAEAYWSPGSDELILQATFPPHECDQIFRLRPEQPGQLDLVSTGKGRTTCAYFFPTGDRILYASTHLADAACPPKPGHSQGYVWPLYETYEIVTAKPDGSDVVALTDNEVYDAEATVCPRDGSIIFTSTRDGDLDLYRMAPDGSNVQRLTDTPGYDGGAFFSSDCSQIVWRASRPKEGEELDDYRRLLSEDLVRPGKLELWVASADGSEARQVTYLDAASFAPYFFPSGDRILFSTNHGDPMGRDFDIWAVDVDGTDLERITYAPGFDGFPMFSPDGKSLAFSSNRNQGKPGETDVYVARWIDSPPAAAEAHAAQPESAADRFIASAEWLADDARDGRGIGTDGLEQARVWLAERFVAAGVEPGAGDGRFEQAFELPAAGERRSADATSVAGDQRPPAAVELVGEREIGHNVIGRIPAAANKARLPGALVVGAHYDHLGFGGLASRVPDVYEPHNGADDNASGTAAVLEVARAVVERRGELRRDVYLVAFAGEESGLRGSTHFVEQPPPGLELEKLVAMLNLDMVGRLRNNRVTALGASSAVEWPDLLTPACDRAGLLCTQSSASHASDQTPFAAAGVPVLHFFTGIHDDYHKPSDDPSKLNAAGGAQIAALVTDLTLALAAREAPLSFRAIP